MPVYRERLWPTPWAFIATALVIPASLLVFLPISTVAGVVCAILLYAACITALVIGSPRVDVVDGEFRAGRARLPLSAVGEVTAYRKDGATAARGPGLDARAWLLIRGWIDPVVRVDLDDPSDPTPYWLISTRRPEELVAALSSQRAAA